MTKPRVLVIAEAANPEWVSVPLVGWQMARALAQVAEVHLVTQVRNREAILRAGLVEGRDFTALDSEAIAGPLWRVGERLTGGKGKGFTMLQAASTLAYPWFERLLWRRFEGDLRAGRWDLVHRVTPLSPTSPSPLAARLAGIGVPFVLGPLNGGVPWPREFQAERRAEREWLSYVRGLMRLLPGHAATYHNASLILAGSRHTASEVPVRDRHKVAWLPENGIDPARFAPRPKPPGAPQGPLRAAFLGRLVPYKGPDMALEAALPHLHAGRMSLDIVGDGPLMPALRAQAEGVPGVTLHGWLPQERVAEVLGAAHLLLFPSVREFGGGAVVEAMATGAVPLVVDYAGPGELVTPGAGLKVPLGPRESIVAAMSAHLGRLAASPSEVEALSAGALRRAQDFTWAAKAAQVARGYDWVLSGAGGPPPMLLEG